MKREIIKESRAVKLWAFAILRIPFYSRTILKFIVPRSEQN